MRVGIVILPDEPWQTSAPRWMQAEELGFHHAWTYDHLVWSGLPNSPWVGAAPLLTAAATVTSTIKLGTLVSSPNVHHPYPFLRDIRGVDDVAGGRLLLGIGAGGNLDAEILGESLPLKERVARFHEFTRLLHRLLLEDHITHRGTYFATVDARTLPLTRSIPLVIAANGPKSLRLAAELGNGWVTTGPPGLDTLEEWWDVIGQLSRWLDDAVAATGRDIDRYLSLDASPQFSLESVEIFDDMVGRATQLGFTDVICHYPRAESPYAGDPAILDRLTLPRS